MLIKQIIKVENSNLHCPECGHDDFPWDDIVYEDGMIIYDEFCQECGVEFREYCTDPGERYLYTTYVKYVEGERSNMRW